MKAEEILKLRVPELLFSAPMPAIIKGEYKELAKEWHPDVSKHPDPDKVFSHISWLMEVALEKANKGEWDVPGIKMFTDIMGTQFKLNYKYRFAFELGATYICNKTIAFVLDQTHRELLRNGARQIRNFKYKDDAMRKEFTRFLPKRILHEIELVNGDWLMIIPKTDDVIPLRGLHEHFKSGLEPTHVAWIMSSLVNLACYLNYTGVAHLAISLDTYYVSPEHHTGLLLGGWWYSRTIGHTIPSVPRETFRKMTDEDKKLKQATTKIDQRLIKALGRTLMGDYMSKKRHPKFAPMIDWLLMPSDPDPIAAFKGWDSVLKETFGKRRFIKLDATVDDIYKTLGG